MSACTYVHVHAFYVRVRACMDECMRKQCGCYRTAALPNCMDARMVMCTHHCTCMCACTTMQLQDQSPAAPLSRGTAFHSRPHSTQDPSTMAARCMRPSMCPFVHLSVYLSMCTYCTHELMRSMRHLPRQVSWAPGRHHLCSPDSQLCIRTSFPAATCTCSLLALPTAYCTPHSPACPWLVQHASHRNNLRGTGLCA
eukprot:366445-Chlamydomonas_euryale.AAC.8